MNENITRRKCLKGSLAALAGTAVAGMTSEIHAQDKPRCPRAQDTLGLLKQGKKIPIIFDTDIGGDIDDTWALLLALQCPDLDVRLLVTDSGAGISGACLAAKYLEVCGRTDVPVAVGIPATDHPNNQSQWVGNYQLDDYPGLVYEDGVGAFIRTIKASPDPVTVVAIGGVPTVSEAIKRDPSIVTNARFVGMQGSIRVGYGVHSKPVAEANVRANPQALAAVFAAPWESTITPLDTCDRVKLTGDKYQKLYRHKNAPLRALMENYRIWLPNASWMKPDYPLETASTTLFDTVAVYLAFSEALVEMEDLPIRMTDEGMTVIDPGARSIRCATRWKNLEAFEDLLVERLLP
jgi:inosine-uridine nucleoside N-ribohydrolase